MDVRRFLTPPRHEAAVKILVARDDVEVDSKDEDGRSPLSYAARYGNEAVVRRGTMSR